MIERKVLIIEDIDHERGTGGRGSESFESPYEFFLPASRYPRIITILTYNVYDIKHYKHHTIVEARSRHIPQAWQIPRPWCRVCYQWVRTGWDRPGEDLREDRSPIERLLSLSPVFPFPDYRFLPIHRWSLIISLTLLSLET